MASGHSGITTRTKGPKSTKNDKKPAQGDKMNRDECDTCVDCGTAVKHTQQGLKCDGCDFWHHTECEGVTDEVYHFLCKYDDDPTITWYCKKCAVMSKKLMAMLFAVQDKMNQIEDSVFGMASTLNSKMDDLSASLSSRLDNKEREGVAIEEVQKNVEAKMDTLADIVKNKAKIDTHFVHDCVEDAVMVKALKDQEELEEIRKRRNNVIIHGLVESTDANPEARQQQEEIELQNLLHEIKCDDVSITDAVRLGKRIESGDGKPRPVRLMVASEHQKDKILRSTKNLRGKKDKGYDSVFIHQDLTPNQRAHRKKLVQEMKARKSNGEENLMIVKGKIVVREKRDVMITSG